MENIYKSNDYRPSRIKGNEEKTGKKVLLFKVIQKAQN